MRPFPRSRHYEYILVVVDYISKWVEAMPCRAADSKHAKRMFQDIIFPRFGTPRIVISNGGSHFIDQRFRKYILDVDVNYKIATPYHPQTSGQAESLNKQIKNILQKTVNEMGKVWKDKLSDALWSYRTTYKTPIGMTLHQLVYGKMLMVLTTKIRPSKSRVREEYTTSFMHIFYTNKVPRVELQFLWIGTHLGGKWT
jgi:transposase InsO family protein